MAPFVSGVTWAIGVGELYTVFATELFHKFGGRLTILLGIVIFAGGVACSSFITNMYGFLFVLLFALGFGAALVAIPCMYLSWLCLPTRKGLASGLMWMGYGFGGMTFGIVFTFLVNPDNQTPSNEVKAGNQTEMLFGSDIADKVPGTLLEVGIGLFLICLTACALVIEAKKPEVRKGLSMSIVSKKVGSVNENAECPSFKTAMKTSSAYLLFLYFWMAYELPLIFLYQYKNYGQEHIRNDHLLSAAGTVGLFANSIARLLVSWLADYVPYRSLMITTSLIVMSLGVTIPFVVDYEYAYFAWVCMIFFCHGGLYSPVALVCGEIYGTKVGSQVFSFVSQGLNISNLVMIPIGVWLIQVCTTQPYGYDTTFFAIGLCSGVAALCAVALKTQYSWELLKSLAHNK